MLGVLRQWNLALLWLAGAVSILGDYVLFSALPFYVYALTGSALATGAMFVAEALPRVALGSIAGAFVDRWDRKRTLVVADLARGALLLPRGRAGGLLAAPWRHCATRCIGGAGPDGVEADCRRRSIRIVRPPASGHWLPWGNGHAHAGCPVRA
jgi:MFS family permease